MMKLDPASVRGVLVVVLGGLTLTVVGMKVIAFDPSIIDGVLSITMILVLVLFGMFTEAILRGDWNDA